jgi:hypothetical protein
MRMQMLSVIMILGISTSALAGTGRVATEIFEKVGVGSAVLTGSAARELYGLLEIDEKPSLGNPNILRKDGSGISCEKNRSKFTCSMIVLSNGAVEGEREAGPFGPR